MVTNTGKGTLDWHIDLDVPCSWLSISSMEGVTDPNEVDEITLFVDVTGLAPGVYECDFIVSDPLAENSPQAVTVVLFVTTLGTGTQANPFLIQNFEDLQAFANPVNSSIYWSADVYTRLTADIDLDSIGVFTTALIAPDTNNSWGGFQGTPYSGNFDGAGHAIANLTINGSTNKDYLGLFGQIASSGMISNIGIVNCNINGDSHLGGLCGGSEGTIDNCYANGNVSGGIYLGGLCGDNSDSVANCYATGSVTGSNILGGLCGNNHGSVANCYATGNVSGKVSSFSLGGLFGSNSGSVANCYAIGCVSGEDNSFYFGGLAGYNGGSLANCYATGSVSGGDTYYYLGGFCGYQYGAKAEMANCFWDTQTSGMSVGYNTDTEPGEITNVLGKTTAEMQIQSTFTDYGWDFMAETINGTEDIWRLCQDGIEYPRFSWDHETADYLCPDGVDLFDYAFFANQWQQQNCGTDDHNCHRTDFNQSGAVDMLDLMIFLDQWFDSDGE